jgi:hypothetical protein
MIYNANLDRSSKNRKSKQELIRELKKWEEDKSKKKRATVEDTAAHEVCPFVLISLSGPAMLTLTCPKKRHKDDFAQLIDAARPRGDKGASTAAKAKRSLLAERSNNDITVPSSSDTDKLQEVSQERRHTEREEDVIVVDSEEEQLEMIQRT